MSNPAPGGTHFGFVKTFVLPALLIFLVPVCAWLFFRSARSDMDKRAGESIRKQILADTSMSSEEREKALAWFAEHPVSQLLHNKEFAAGVTADARFRYTLFRWMIRIAAGCIIAGLLVIAAAGICVALSYRSQYAQYISLSVGWHVLRAFATLQAIAQGILLCALSFWVTALWFEFYSIKLILVISCLALIGVGLAVVAIFKRPKTDRRIEGSVIGQADCPALWNELGAICEKTKTARPDQLIAGIDDNFFVTEMPVVVDKKFCSGRTLFVSLPLLKALDGVEADAILAHEMAHFSGDDTLYSKKISPLLVRYNAYLETMQGNPAALPIFYFMLCFRALFQASLGHLSRQREFRADRIAAKITSPAVLARSLLRVTAYSHFRGKIEGELFQQERAIAAANIAQQVESGFSDYAKRFAFAPELATTHTPHPFDSHPPLAQRLSAFGIPCDPEHVTPMLSAPGDGAWYQRVEPAAEIEQKLWAKYEAGFQEAHSQHLPYRFLPENEQEREIVVAAFPPITIEGKEGTLACDHEKMHYSQWSSAIEFREITSCKADDSGVLWIHYKRDKAHKERIPLKKFPNKGADVLAALNHYWSRYQMAVAYQKSRKSAEK